MTLQRKFRRERERREARRRVWSVRVAFPDPPGVVRFSFVVQAATDGDAIVEAGRIWKRTAPAELLELEPLRIEVAPIEPPDENGGQPVAPD